MTVIPIKPIDERDPLDDFSDLFEDVKGASSHEIEVAIGSVKPARVPFRSVHPIIRKFPQMPDDAYGKLHDDIRENGQQKAICMYQGMIWDGRARYDACLNLGLVPRVWALRAEDPIIYLLKRDNDKYGAANSPERDAALEVLRHVRDPGWNREAKKRRSEWIATARAEFMRAYRVPRPCAVCGLFGEYSHAHHSLPLGVQYDHGVDEPIQEFDWVCPVHHRRLHQLIAAQLLGSRREGEPDYRYRYASEDAKAKAHEATYKLIDKARQLFTQIGGVPVPGNWRMLQP